MSVQLSSLNSDWMPTLLSVPHWADLQSSSFSVGNWEQWYLPHKGVRKIEQGKVCKYSGAILPKATFLVSYPTAF